MENAKATNLSIKTTPYVIFIKRQGVFTYAGILRKIKGSFTLNELDGNVTKIRKKQKG